MEVGLFGNILSSRYSRYGCLETKGKWFENLWEFLSEIGMSLELYDKHHFKPVRIGDNFLMDLFFQHLINHWQVSDIISYDGQIVEPSMSEDTPGDYVQ